MTRTSRDWIVEGRLIQGFDYENQAWVQSGYYLDCGHKKDLDCGCYGRAHKGEPTKAPENVLVKALEAAQSYIETPGDLQPHEIAYLLDDIKIALEGAARRVDSLG